MSTQSSSEPMYKNLGDELLAALGSDTTQTELALKLYVTPVAVHYWLTGHRRPRPAMLGALGAILKRSPYDLAQLAGYEDPTTIDTIEHAYEDRLILLNRKVELHDNRRYYT